MGNRGRRAIRIRGIIIWLTITTILRELKGRGSFLLGIRRSQISRVREGLRIDGPKAHVIRKQVRMIDKTNLSAGGQGDRVNLNCTKAKPLLELGIVAIGG
jgi:hypothetical protein